MTRDEATALLNDLRTVFNTLGIRYDSATVHASPADGWRIEVKRRHGTDYSFYGIRHRADLDFFAKKWATQ